MAGLARRAGMSLLDDVWQYPLFEALYGRRSRRFARGFAIVEGPFQHASHATTLPLTELEEALLVASGVGITGGPLWDMGRPGALRLDDGRAFPRTSRGRRTVLFFTHDARVVVVGPTAAAPATRDTPLPVLPRPPPPPPAGSPAVPRA